MDVQLKSKDKKDVKAAAQIWTGDGKVTLGFEEEKDKLVWVVAINGIRTKNFAPCIDAVSLVCDCASRLSIGSEVVRIKVLLFDGDGGGGGGRGYSRGAVEEVGEGMVWL